MQEVTWDDTVLNGINYLNKSVLQVPFLLMTLMRYVTPTLDEMYVSCLLRYLLKILTSQIHGIHKMG